MMEAKNLWRAQLPEDLAVKFENFKRYLNALSDGTMDVEGYLDTPYGAELGRRLLVRCSIQDDQEAAETWYKSLGLSWEFHFPEDYYRRWKLFYPQTLDEGKRYPILFWNHGGGNSIESEEPMTGYLQLAAKEGLFLVMAQNTNAENALSILDDVAARFPIDTGRVYLAGFSQGSNQCHSLYSRHPERIAAVALTCIDIWRPWDNFDDPYTAQELERLKDLTVPMCLQVGACEPFAYAPLNDWHKNRMNPVPREMRGRPDDFEHPGKIEDNDPTRITTPGKGRYDPGKPNITRMASGYMPQEGEDVHIWSVERVNRRLELLNCSPRDVERCADYFADESDGFHHITGIYGDKEETRDLYGVKHHIVDILDRDGLDVFRYIVTDNSPHWPPVTTAELGWAFLRRFRREDGTGRLIQQSKREE